MTTMPRPLTDTEIRMASTQAIYDELDTETRSSESIRLQAELDRRVNSSSTSG